MKLNKEFLIFDMGGDRTLVPTGKAAENYHGIVRCNETAAFLMECLKIEMTEEALVEAMEKEYEGEHEQIAANVKRTLETLRSIGAIEE